MKRFLFGVLPLLVTAVTAATAVTACTSNPDYPAIGNGELQNGSFTYLCTTPSDPFCAGTVNATLIPTGIAVGTNFRIAFATAPGEAPVTIGLLGTSLLTLADDGTIDADQPGYGSVFARNASGEVEDYVNLHIVTVSSVTVLGVDAMTTLKPDETRAVRAQPLGPDGTVLAGSGTWDWETSDPNVVAIDTTDEDRARGTASVRAVGPGAARVRAIFGSATTTVDIVVGS